MHRLLLAAVASAETHDFLAAEIKPWAGVIEKAAVQRTNR